MENNLFRQTATPRIPLLIGSSDEKLYGIQTENFSCSGRFIDSLRPISRKMMVVQFYL